jgi:hypothetical protein
MIGAASGWAVAGAAAQARQAEARAIANLMNKLLCVAKLLHEYAGTVNINCIREA